MASMFELVRNVYYFFMGLLVMYVSFLSDQYLWSKETTPAAFRYIEEICIQPNFRNYTFDCTKLLTPDPEDVKAVTSKEDLLMVVLTKTSTLAQSLLDDLNELNRSSLGWGWVDNKSEVLDCIDEFDIIAKLFDAAVSSLRGEGGDPATLDYVFRHIEIYQTACMNRLREVRTSFTKKDSKMSKKQRSLLVALFITSSLLKKSIELGESTRAWLTHFHSKEFKRRDDVKPDIVVAQDGSGHVKTIFEAVELAPKFGSRPFVIKIMAGVYREYVVIAKDKTKLRFVGESSRTTIITDNRYHCGVSIIESATMSVYGFGFTAEELTIENTAKPTKQAVALAVSADRVAFYKCNFTGYQNTLYVHKGNQFYKNCIVEGTMNFIFGMGSAVHQECLILVKEPLLNQRHILTVDGRNEDPKVLGNGISIQKSVIGAAADNTSLKKSSNTIFLGRTFGNVNQTAIIQCYIGHLIHLDWNDQGQLGSTNNVEHENYGVGTNLEQRVKGKGYNSKLSREEVEEYSARNFIYGESWLPETGFPFDLDIA